MVASLLLMHGLYPVPLEDRVREALDSVRPYMESHGGDVELLGIADGVRGCGSRDCRLRGVGSTLELGSAGAAGGAPDLEGIEVEGLRSRGGSAADGAAGWLSVRAGAAAGVLATVDDLAGRRPGGDLLAYRNACAACGGRLDDGC